MATEAVDGFIVDGGLDCFVVRRFPRLLEMEQRYGVTGDPLFSRVFRWERGMPQYTMGHLARVETIEARTGTIQGLALAGGSYRGVGLPNCIESGERAVSKVLGEWGIELGEDSDRPKRAH